MRAWLVLAAWAGLRAMELAALRREDVHEHDDPPMLVVRDGKGQKGRAVPLSRLVLDELAPILDAHDSAHPWLFPSRLDHRRSVSAGTVSNLANEHLRSLGNPDTLHSLRHRFASELYRVTLDLRLCQEMLGHASPATTAIYTPRSARPEPLRRCRRWAADCTTTTRPPVIGGGARASLPRVTVSSRKPRASLAQVSGTWGQGAPVGGCRARDRLNGRRRHRERRRGAGGQYRGGTLMRTL